MHDDAYNGMRKSIYKTEKKVSTVERMRIVSLFHTQDEKGKGREKVQNKRLRLPGRVHPVSAVVSCTLGTLGQTYVV
jgi:3,4-dihydroxy-2-butanone 4-phosphate synthase